MKHITLILFLFVVGLQWSFARPSNPYYGRGLCANPAYDCIKIKRGQNWNNLFPNPDKRDLVQRVNRTNMRLWRGRTIAVPKNLKKLTMYDVAPFALKVKASSQKMIIVDQEKLAWAAYDANGYLVKWGAISSGKDYCRDIKRSCTTKTGVFYVFNKKDRKCVSKIFPVGRGGAKMPYCMFFYRGFALHGSSMVPGYRDSHGCIRLFTRDARWLNKEFVAISSSKNNFRGTKVVIQKLHSVKLYKKKVGKKKHGRKYKRKRRT